MAYKIMLDPGHGGTDPGAVYEGRQEKDDALRLATAVGEIFLLSMIPHLKKQLRQIMQEQIYLYHFIEILHLQQISIVECRV